MERETGIEPATSSLGSWRSTAELLPLVLQTNMLASGYRRFAAHLLHNVVLCLQTDRGRRPDMQRGRVYEASGKFYVQYRVAGKQVSKFLCDKTPAFYSKTCKAVRLKADEIMLTVNKEAVSQPKPMADMRISDFWEQRYLPYCTELTADGRPRMKPSTVRHWKQIWGRYLSGHFSEMMLSEYRANFGTQFLDSLTAQLSRQTLQHIRNLGHLIFKRAVAECRINANPFRDVVMPRSAVKDKPTECYTWTEAAEVIAAFPDRPDVQLIFALCCYCGLRPNEVVALRVEDIDGDWLHIRRGFVRGRLDVPKTRGSVDAVPLPEPIRKQLEIYAAGKQGWLFSNGGFLTSDRITAPEMKHLAGPSPLDLQNLGVRVIRPRLAERGIAYKPLKAGRTGTCTQIVEQTGRMDLAQRVLRHDDVTTTARFYKKQMSNRAALEGVRTLQLPETPID
jgi:integrase